MFIFELFSLCFSFFSCKKDKKVSSDDKFDLFDVKVHGTIQLNLHVNNYTNNFHHQHQDWDIENNCGKRPENIPIPIAYPIQNKSTTTIIHRKPTEKYYRQQTTNTNKINKNKQLFYLHTTKNFLYTDNDRHKYVNEDIENGYGFFIILD